MIDVVFLLLIFFIATYKEDVAEAHMPIDMPSATAASTLDQPIQLIEITVLAGEYRFTGGHVASLDKIAGTLAMFAEFDTEQTVIIKVSRQARHYELIQLLDRCKQAGFTKLDVVTMRGRS